MSRLFFGALFACAISFAASAADDPNKCTIAVKGESDVKKGCDAGGIKRAKAVMKAQVKLAKDKGMKLECDDCHKDESNGNWRRSIRSRDGFTKRR